MTLKAEIGARFGANLAMWIMACRAIHPSRATNLMRMGDLLLALHVRMAAVTDVRRDRAHFMRVSLN